MNRSILRLCICLLVLVGQNMQAQTIVERPANLQDLDDAWQWAQVELLQQDSAWIAYSFTSRIDERLSVRFSSRDDNYIEWNRAGSQRWGNHWYYNNGGGWRNQHTLAGLRAGINSAQQDFEVSKELLLLMRTDNQQVEEIHLVALDTLINWQALPVYWLGEFAEEESFRHLLGLLGQYSEQALQRTLVRAVGMHNSFDRDSALISIFDNTEFASIQPATLEALAIRKSDSANDKLVEVATDQNADVISRRIAISALSRYPGTTNVSLLSELSALGNPQAIRREAVESLSLIPGEASLRVLQELVARDDNRAVVMEALVGLARYPDQYETVAELAESHADAEMRETAMELAAHMNDSRAFSLLERIFNNDPSMDLREEALQAMDAVPEAQAVPFLLEVANNVSSYEEDLRAEAVDTLAEFSPELVISDLNRLAWSDSSEDVRENAVKALADLIDSSVNSLLLEIARNHPSNHTRREAMDELEDRLL